MAWWLLGIGVDARVNKWDSNQLKLEVFIGKANLVTKRRKGDDLGIFV